MIVGNTSDKESVPQTKFGTTNTGMRVLIGPDEGAEIFTMRIIEIEVGGQIGLHDHPWEHEIYVVRGRGNVFIEGQKEDLEPGRWVWIPSDEPHGFENTGEQTLAFICCIPQKKD